MSMEKKVITKIEVQKRNKERVNVYINDEFAFACSAELIYAHSLLKGKSISIDYLEEIIDEDNYIKCKSTALRSIEKAYKTQKQLFDKLTEKGYNDKAIRRTIEFLKQYKFIDDEKFVVMYINDKLNSHGKNKIKYELLKRGIDETLLSENLNNADKGIEENAALRLAEKKYKLLTKSESDFKKIYKKMGDYLVRKGYNLDIVQKVLDDVVKQDLSDSDVFKGPNEEKDEQVDINTLRELAEKRYRTIIKSEKDNKKVYKKLSDYLLRRGYSWENIKSTLKEIISNLND